MGDGGLPTSLLVIIITVMVLVFSLVGLVTAIFLIKAF
jgi:hypothetical protein